MKPARAAVIGSTLKIEAGPLIVSSMPFLTSFTPGIILMASPIFGPHWRNRSAFCENSLIWIGSGELVRSPIISWRSWINVVSSCGNCRFTLARTSAMISSTPRSRFALSLTETSPVLASVTAARPSCSPVRRDVLSTSGTA